jgi:hypothetical protein
MLWGKETKKTSIVRYIKRMTKREAEAIARKWAVKDHAHMVLLRDLPLKERDELEAAGGMSNLLEGHWAILVVTPTSRQQGK